MQCPDSSLRAFSLVELLVVMAVIAILLGLALSGAGLLSGASPHQRAKDLALLLEQARTFATSRQTPVWVGFQEIESPDAQLRVLLIASADGTLDIAPENLHPVTQIKSVQRVALSADQPPSTGEGMVQNARRSGSETTLLFQGNTWSHVITFSPQGFASLPPEAPGPNIGIGLAPATGNSPTAWLRLQPATGKVLHEKED